MARETIIPQHPALPDTDRGEQPILPTGFDYEIAGQPEKLHQPFKQISGQPVMPSRQMDAIDPFSEQEY